MNSVQYAHLEIFITVAELQSFSQAARVLYVSQPAISQVIQKMEKELGFRLFIRNKNSGISLSEAGKEFYAFAKPAVQNYTQVIQRCRKIENRAENTIVVALEQICATLLKHSTLDVLANASPALHVQIQYGNFEQSLESVYNGTADCAFVQEPLHLDPAYTFHNMTTDSFSCTIRPKSSLASRSSLTIHDLAGQTVLLQGQTKYKDYNKLSEVLAKQDIFTEDNGVFLRPMNKECIFLISSVYAPFSPKRKILPFSETFYVHYGFVTKKNCDELLTQFLQANTKSFQ